ncbi:MAG: alpha/beta hydrolase [Deltaproteobacteria bacterium]|nr:alpha/beta hydrolase [Deltaproteobacteria bacterium]
MKFQEIDGVKIAFRVNEGGFVPGRKTLFFIHGSAGDYTVWENQYAGMEDEFNMVAVNLPGHGESGGSGEREVALYAKWVKKTVEALGLRKPVLAGHSLGAAIVLESAIRYGDMLSGIVTVGGGAKMPVNPLVLDGMKDDPSKIINSIPAFAVSKRHRERLKDFLIENFNRIDKEVAYGNFLACDRFDISGKLGQIRIPTLLICGEDDKMMPPKFSMYLEEKITGAKLVLIKEAGHFVMMEDAESFNAALREFVNSLEG